MHQVYKCLNVNFDKKESRMRNFFAVLISIASFLTLFGQQEVRIGKYVLSTTDLAVTTFNNGDIIPVVKSAEEANSYALKGKPSCIKVGGSVWYNWYAVNDPRGIAPAGWHVPNEWELSNLIDFCRSNIYWVAEKKNRTILPGTPTRVEYLQPEFNWWAYGENKEFYDSFVQQLSCPSAIGPLTLEIAKKTDFYPVRVFANNPNQIFAREYFLKTQNFEVNTGNEQWKLVVKCDNCDSDAEEANNCIGKATLFLTNTTDSLEHYKIEIDDFGFTKKEGLIISDLGVRFEDFNFDGKLDFGLGFGSDPFEYPSRVFFLDDVRKKAEFNKEFNRLFLLGEISSFELQTRTFEGFTSMADSYEIVEYYSCPTDSLENFARYTLPSELEPYRIKYPNLFLVNYFSFSDHEITRFNPKSYGYEQYTLDDWGYGEMHAVKGGHPYWVELTKDGIHVEVQKIDSAAYHIAAQSRQENPFNLISDHENYNSETIYLKRYAKGVKRKGDKLILKTENGQLLEFKNTEEPYCSSSYFGLTEDQKSWIVRSAYEESEAYVQYIINCATGSIDSSMFSFPRYSPNGMYCAEGDYADMEGIGSLILYSLKNGKWLPIVNVTFENLEFSFAPYDLFWIDDKTMLVKQLKFKSSQQGDEYFEYAKFMFDFNETRR
jgi:uncharacterized protein (TIGR02145 family)